MNAKKRLNNKSGFTLLEIIIVIIIIGVLASLALPKLFAMVEKSKSTEALAAMGSIRSALERCALAKGNSYVGCDLWTELDMADPTTQPGSHFDYTFPAAPVAWTATTYSILATRNASDGGASLVPIPTITVYYDATGAHKTGTGIYQGI